MTRFFQRAKVTAIVVETLAVAQNFMRQQDFTAYSFEYDIDNLIEVNVIARNNKADRIETIKIRIDYLDPANPKCRILKKNEMTFP